MSIKEAIRLIEDNLYYKIFSFLGGLGLLSLLVFLFKKYVWEWINAYKIKIILLKKQNRQNKIANRFLEIYDDFLSDGSQRRIQEIENVKYYSPCNYYETYERSSIWVSQIDDILEEKHLVKRDNNKKETIPINTSLVLKVYHLLNRNRINGNL